MVPCYSLLFLALECFTLLHHLFLPPSFFPPPLTSLLAPLLSSVFLGSGCNCRWSMGCISTAWLFPGPQCCSCWSFWLRLQATVICFNIFFWSVTQKKERGKKKKNLLKNGQTFIVELGLIHYDIDVRCQNLMYFTCHLHQSIYRSRIRGKIFQPLQFNIKDNHMYVSVCFCGTVSMCVPDALYIFECTAYAPRTCCAYLLCCHITKIA